jgi:hypothetical protein
MDSQPGCLPLLLLVLIPGLGAYFVASSFSTTVEETAAPMQSPKWRLGSIAVRSLARALTLMHS